MRSASFWHSRLKLFTSSIALLILLFLYEFKNTIHGTGSQKETLKSIWGNFDEDSGNALEAIAYMKLLPLGKDSVREVWENEQGVEEFKWACYPEFPRSIAKSGNWMNIDRRLQMYSAYVDRRENGLFPNNDAIQVLAMSEDSIENQIDLYCTIHTNREVVVVKGYIREIWQRGWDPRRGFWTPNLITCPLPNRIRNQVSFIVSLSKKPCVGGKEAFRVEDKKTIKTRKENDRLVAVCVKGMDFQEEIGDRLVEWLEAQRLFGVDRVAVYTYSVSARTRRILQHFVDQRVVEWTNLSLPNHFPNDPFERSAYIWRNRQQKRRLELIPYNDCFYRFINSHDYVLIVDLDEVIVPLLHDTYSSMLFHFEKEKSTKRLSSISVRNVFKFPAQKAEHRFAEYLYMLRNKERSRKTSKLGDYGKSFTSTKNVVTVFNHFALHKQFKEISASVALPEKIAVKLHYKEKCPVESRNECVELLSDRVNDTSLDRWAEQLRERVQSTRELLKL